MLHPVFRSWKSVVVYFGAWIIVTMVQFSILFFFYGVPGTFAFIDSLIFNMMFSLMGIILWFVVRYCPLGKGITWNMLFNHLSSAALILVGWMATSYFLLSSIFPSEARLLHFIRDSLPSQAILGVMLYVLTGLGYYLILMYNDLQERLKEEARLSELLRESELNVLKSQINPHFLFNSLNSVSSLTITDPEKAQEMVIRLSDFLRYSVSASSKQFVSLNKEMENIERYLEIEKVRFGKKLDYIHHIDPACQSMMIPATVLQPLFENAIKHGLYESTGTVCIETTCTHDTGMTIITMVNDFDSEAPRKSGTGVGLSNIRERLRLLYHRTDLLEFRAEDAKFKVILKIPDNHE